MLRAPPIVTHRYLPARLQRLSGYMRQARSHAHSAGARAVSGLRSCGLADPQQFQDRRRSLVPEKLQSHAELIKYSPLIGTAHVVCGAGSINRRGVRLSVRPSVRLSVPFASCSSVLRVCCCGPGEQGTSINCYSVRAAECGQCHVVSVHVRSCCYVNMQIAVSLLSTNIKLL